MVRSGQTSWILIDTAGTEYFPEMNWQYPWALGPFLVLLQGALCIRSNVPSHVAFILPMSTAYFEVRDAHLVLPIMGAVGSRRKAIPAARQG